MNNWIELKVVRFAEFSSNKLNLSQKVEFIWNIKTKMSWKVLENPTEARKKIKEQIAEIITKQKII